MDRYLDAKAMLAPGIAGATVTTLTANLVNMFSLKGNWTALALSFVVGILVWADKDVPLLQRGVLYVLNSLIIFSVAAGLNMAGYDIVVAQRAAEAEQNGPVTERDLPATAPNDTPFFKDWSW